MLRRCELGLQTCSELLGLRRRDFFRLEETTRAKSKTRLQNPPPAHKQALEIEWKSIAMASTLLSIANTYTFDSWLVLPNQLDNLHHETEQLICGHHLSAF